MNSIRFFILCFVFGLSACNGPDANTESTGTDSAGTMKFITDSNMTSAAIESNQATNRSIKAKGVYRGVFPCPDCAGIVTEMRINKNDTYNISSQYLGKKDSKMEMNEGNFIWINDSTIQLDGMKNSQGVKYCLTDTAMRQLDINGNRILGELGSRYTLTKN